MRELDDHKTADRVFDCRTECTQGFPCNKRSECFSCAARKAFAEYRTKLKAAVLRMQDPQEFRFSLPTPRAFLLEGVTELRELLRKLRTRTAWRHVVAEIGMIHRGELRNGWWNLHVHLFCESVLPIDQREVRRAWKALTNQKNRRKYWTKQGMLEPRGGFHSATLHVGEELRDLEKMATYLTRPDQFAPGDEEISNADFDILRKALKNRQLLVSRGLDGRGGPRQCKLTRPTDKLLAITVQNSVATMAHGIFADIRRSEGKSDMGLGLEKLCQSSLWPLRGDRWARLAEIFDVAESQLDCQLIAYDAATGELVRGAAAQLFAEEGNGWSEAEHMLLRSPSTNRHKEFGFVLRDDSDPTMFRVSNEFLKTSCADISQVAFVDFAFAETAKLCGDDSTSRVFEALCAIHRMTEPGTTYRGSSDRDAIIAAKRPIILPSMERAFGVWLVACDLRQRAVFYGRETIDWYVRHRGVAA